MFCSFKIVSFWDFPGGPVAKTPGSNSGGPGSILGQGTRSHMPPLKVPHAAAKTQCTKLGKKYIILWYHFVECLQGREIYDHFKHLIHNKAFLQNVF